MRSMMSGSATDSTRGGDGALGRLDPRRSDDELLAFTLIQVWALTTGRTLRSDVLPERLSARDLIEFWSDPYNDPDSEV
jgi:hypothetical protein